GVGVGDRRFGDRGHKLNDMRTTALALMTLAAAVAARASTATLAKAQFPSVRKTARFVTLQKWDGRVDGMLGSYGQAHAAPAAWRLSNPLDPAVVAVQKKWGARAFPPGSPVHEAVKDASVKRLMDARASAVRFLSTGFDGQLQLLLFDRQDAFQHDIDAALAACAKAKHN